MDFQRETAQKLGMAGANGQIDHAPPQPPNPQPQRKGRPDRRDLPPTIPPHKPSGPGRDFGRHGVPKGAVTRSGALPKSRGGGLI